MPLSDVTITLSNGNLGRLPASPDGLPGFVFGPTAVAPSNASLLTPYLVRSLAEVEALGIDEEYDNANDILVWHHMKDFYEERQGAQPVWMILTNQVQTAHFDLDQEADKLMNASGGNIRLVTGCFTPTAAITAHTDGLPTVLISVIADAKAFVARQFALHRPVRVLLEGYAIESPDDLEYDLMSEAAGPNANMVQVVIGQNRSLLSDGYSGIDTFASVARVTARYSKIPVDHSAARVKDGELVGVIAAGFSDGTALAEVSSTTLNALHDMGYVFFQTRTGLPGFYINGDHMACPDQDDYANMPDGRVIDKAARIAYDVYVRELNESVELNNTGKMTVSVIKNLEGMIESAIGTRMAGEISGVKAYIDPEQNITVSETCEVELSILRNGIIRNFKVKLGYTASLSA